jgi:hypothetical protein
MDLDEWNASVHPWLTGLEAVLPVDFSRRSLADLERVAHRINDNAAAAYLGETLLRVGGGRWVERDGVFAVTADPALDLPAVVPGDLIEEDGEPTATYDEWAAAVAERRATDPDWEPVVEYTPGLGPEDNADSAATDRWLTEREDRFPAWVARWAPDGVWDFSPSSLDRLAELLVRELGDDPVALLDPANGDLSDVAAWYVGEACRQAGNGEWSWDDPPIVICLGPNLDEVEPLDELGTGMRTPGHLGRRWTDLAGLS